MPRTCFRPPSRHSHVQLDAVIRLEGGEYVEQWRHRLIKAIETFFNLPDWFRFLGNKHYDFLEQTFCSHVQQHSITQRFIARLEGLVHKAISQCEGRKKGKLETIKSLPQACRCWFAAQAGTRRAKKAEKIRHQKQTALLQVKYALDYCSLACLLHHCELR